MEGIGTRRNTLLRSKYAEKRSRYVEECFDSKDDLCNSISKKEKGELATFRFFLEKLLIKIALFIFSAGTREGRC